MRVMGIDPTDPQSAAGVCGFAILDVRADRCHVNSAHCPTGFPWPEIVAVSYGTLKRGRECDELCELIDCRQVEAVAIEVAREVYLDGDHKGPAARRAITRALLGQNLLAGALTQTAATHLDGAGHMVPGRGQVVQIEAPEWRKRIGVKVPRARTGQRRRTVDSAVEIALRLRVPNWPARSNAHERDGAGAALGAFACGRAGA